MVDSCKVIVDFFISSAYNNSRENPTFHIFKEVCNHVSEYICR